ncbi:MAG: glycerophosphodiester phosphodiesterase [Eubacterium sp.]
MAEKISRWQKFKRFLRRNMTPTWAKHFSYQVISFLVSVAMVVGVANYAITKTYDERKLSFVEGFTITAHTGAFDTPDNTLASVQAAIDNKVDVFEMDVRQRPDGTIVMGHDIITTNSDGVEIKSAFEMLKPTGIKINLDIKETKALPELYKLIKECKMEEQVFLTGLDQSQTKIAKNDCPGINYYVNYQPSRYKIFSDDYQQKILKMLDETGAVGINCNHTYASRTLSDVLHKNGYKLSVWTVDKERNMKRALIIRPDNITTHYPDQLQNLIDNWGE